MISDRLKAEQKKYYRLLDKAEKRYAANPSEEIIGKLVLINRILEKVCEKIADEHQEQLAEATFPEDKAHHLAHVLGYSELAEKHEEAAEEFAELIAKGVVERDLGDFDKILASI